LFTKFKSLSLLEKKNYYGYLFILPFLLGFILFFLSPLIKGIIFSFNHITIGPKGLELEYIGFEHYHRAFFIDPEFRQILVNSILDMITNVPIIIIFSFFAANLLNQKFKGRFAARAIFFLPVILASGVIARIEMNDAVLQMMLNPAEEATNLGLTGFNLKMILREARLHPAFVNYILLAIDRIYSVINDSGVQILIFLAGLQSIPPALFEVAKVEGSTAWESFWKITFPMVSPLILVNIIYSIIDSFTKSDNEVMNFIHDKAFTQAQFGYSSSLSWIYMLVVIVLLVIIGLIYRRRVFYYE